ncbi:hypothetical protein B0H34DRAFT_129994 [Crassisporium funariophilum]|nr:hypothetical protein B0H34DRAFT_129994 [Crassisporium funariophilum]
MFVVNGHHPVPVLEEGGAVQSTATTQFMYFLSFHIPPSLRQLHATLVTSGNPRCHRLHLHSTFRHSPNTVLSPSACFESLPSAKHFRRFIGCTSSLTVNSIFGRPPNTSLPSSSAVSLAPASHFDFLSIHWVHIIPLPLDNSECSPCIPIRVFGIPFNESSWSC